MKIFLLFLFGAAWQDARRKKISASLLWGFGLAGAAGCIIFQRDPALVFMSAAVGGGILILSRITEGGIGEGDGWFFVVSGLFLNPWENLLLFLSGLFLSALCGLLVLAVSFLSQTSMRGQRMAFLPFLVPGGIWIALL